MKLSDLSSSLSSTAYVSLLKGGKGNARPADKRPRSEPFQSPFSTSTFSTARLVLRAATAEATRRDGQGETGRDAVDSSTVSSRSASRSAFADPVSSSSCPFLSPKRAAQPSWHRQRHSEADLERQRNDEPWRSLRCRVTTERDEILALLSTTTLSCFLFVLSPSRKNLEKRSVSPLD